MSAQTPRGADSGNALPAGHRLHEYEIVRVIGVGGFGIVYLANDLQLRRTVALKEYMPESLAARAADHGISVRSQRHRETFDLGLRSFVNEAHLLASFDHPSLIKVYRFWEQNGTAYMVMPFYEGPTLKALLKQSPQAFDEAGLKALLAPLLDALELIHADNCYHRDIAPDNILLLGPQLKPLLLDFGAARRVIGDATQALTVILKPGYAPVEQYAEMPSMKQGAWTDVYALCAVLYKAITGREPIPSVGRLLKDEMVPVSHSARGRYSAPFLAAIDRGLAVRPEARLQDVAALRAALFAVGRSAADDDDRTVIITASKVPPAFEPMAGNRAPEAPRQAAAHEVPVGGPFDAAVASKPARSGTLAMALVVGAIAVMAAVAWFVVGNQPAARIPNAAIVATAPLAPAPQPPQPAAPEISAAPTRGPFTSVAALEDIVRHADPLISVNTLADQPSLVIGREKMHFRVKSSEAGYLYVLFSDTEGQLSLLFPNGKDDDNRIAADTEVLLPRKHWEITAYGPPGVNHIVTMMSRLPRYFSGAGLKVGGDIREFDAATLQRLWAAAPTGESPYAGAALCQQASTCDAAFGATLITIAEVDASK